MQSSSPELWLLDAFRLSCFRSEASRYFPSHVAAWGSLSQTPSNSRNDQLGPRLEKEFSIAGMIDLGIHLNRVFYFRSARKMDVVALIGGHPENSAPVNSAPKMALSPRKKENFSD